jgi:hypothetical protein
MKNEERKTKNEKWAAAQSGRPPLRAVFNDWASMAVNAQFS